MLHAMAALRNFRGVRMLGPKGDLYDDEAFRSGFEALQRLGLVFDKWHHPHEDTGADISTLPRLAALARAFPGVTIVLDHLGGAVGPRLSQSDVAEWREAIVELAACPNVVCKVGGIQMVVNGWGLEKRDVPVSSDELLEMTFPWYEHVIRSFGASRCMFESNFPVDRDCVSYRTLWNTFKKVAARLRLSDAEKDDIFRGTAVRVYRLELDAPVYRHGKL